MDSTSAKNLITRIRDSDLDEDEQEEAISLVEQERKRSRPDATVMVRGPGDDDMGGQVRLTLGDSTPVELTPPEGLKREAGYGEEDYVSFTVDLELSSIDDRVADGDGRGGPHGSEEWILADYHLTYRQGKDLLHLVDMTGENTRVGTPGDIENELRRLFGDPENLNRWIREIQENGVRGFRRI